MISPSRSTPLIAVALAGLFVPAPARAQEGVGLEGNFRTGTHSFRRILFEQKFTALAEWDDLSKAPEKTLLIVLGKPDLDKVPGGIGAFLNGGGAALIATDQRLSSRALAQFTGYEVDGKRVSAWPPGRFDMRGLVPGKDSQVEDQFIYRGIPPNGAQALFDFLIVQPVNDGGPPIFQNLNRRLGEPVRLVTNRPSYLVERVDPKPPGSHVLARFPRGSWYRSEVFDRGFLDRGQPPHAFAVSAERGNSRVLLLADHSVFINEMMKERDNNNVEFAEEAIQWLQRDGRRDKRDWRDRVLFVEEGVIRTHLDVPFREDVLSVIEFEKFFFEPQPEEGLPEGILNWVVLEEQDAHRRTNEVNKVAMEVANEALGATIFSRSRPENFFLFLLILTIIVLVLWSLRRIRSACHKQDALVPLLAAAVKREAPHLPVPRLRQKYAIREDALWDSGREIARDWLNSLPSLPPPEYEAPGKPPRRPRLDPRAGVFQARKFELLFQRVWQLAWSEVPRRMSEWELRMMLVQMEQFQEALEAGDIRFAQPGDREPLARAASRRR